MASFAIRIIHIQVWGFRFQVSVFGFQCSGFRFQVSGFSVLVSVFWFAAYALITVQILRFLHLTPDT